MFLAPAQIEIAVGVEFAEIAGGHLVGGAAGLAQVAGEIAPAASTSRTISCLAAALRRMFRKPGPAISIASTQRAKAGVASSAALSCSPSARGLSLSGLASCMAAVQAKSPCAATLGDSKAARRRSRARVFQLAGQRREQFLFDGEHARILRAGVIRLGGRR